jgi:phage N-6-adenine-methyltransferase
VSLVRFQAKNHRQQVAARSGADDSVDDRATVPAEFAKFSECFGPFTVDVAAAAHNAKCDRYYTYETNGLKQSWAGERVWCNPPYSRIGAWVEKAWREHGSADGIVMLLPANRTEQGWWQHWVEPHRDRAGSPLAVLFLSGRMRFIKAGSTDVGPNERPPFGVCLVTWGLREQSSQFHSRRSSQGALDFGDSA